MAENSVVEPVETHSWLRPYRAVLASRARSQRAYRASFALDLASSLLVGAIELAEIWVLFHNVDQLGGLDFAEILLVFGLADLCYSLADMSFGHCDNLPTYLRAGTLEVFYLRPQPLLLQLVTSDISLRRLARAAVGAVALTARPCPQRHRLEPRARPAARNRDRQRLRDVRGDVRVGGRRAVLPHRGRRDDQRVRVRRPLRGDPARLGLEPAVVGGLRVLLPDGVHRVPAGARCCSGSSRRTGCPTGSAGARRSPRRGPGCWHS